MSNDKKPRKIKSLKIGRRCFDLLHTLPETGIVGYTDFDHNSLHIEPNQTPEEYLETLLHEILHAVWLGLPNRTTEERAVTHVAHGLTQVLLVNSKFADYLEHLVRVTHGNIEENK